MAQNSNVDIEETQSALTELVKETDRIVRELQAHNHEPVKMTEAELWECYIHPFTD